MKKQNKIIKLARNIAVGYIGFNLLCNNIMLNDHIQPLVDEFNNGAINNKPSKEREYDSLFKHLESDYDSIVNNHDSCRADSNNSIVKHLENRYDSLLKDQENYHDSIVKYHLGLDYGGSIDKLINIRNSYLGKNNGFCLGGWWISECKPCARPVISYNCLFPKKINDSDIQPFKKKKHVEKKIGSHKRYYWVGNQ